MTYRFDLVLRLCSGIALALAVACGGSVYTTSDGDAAGGSTGSGSTSSSGGASSGGSAAGGGSNSGGSAAGGASSGGSGTGGNTILGACNVASDCVAVLDAAAPCYSPGCSAPLAASQQDVAQDHCLVLWDNRESPAPAGCASPNPVVCPASCIAPPSCVTPVCQSGQCQLQLGYTDSACAVTSDDCATLNAKRQTALEAARACNPNLDNIQCNATETVEDMCGCTFIVNETHPDLVQAARDARAAWSAACPAPSCPYGVCAIPVSGSCGADGVCAY